MAIQIVPNGGANAAADSVSIPLTDLTAFGLVSSEMSVDEAGKQASLFSMLQAIAAEDFSSVIGLTKPTQPTFTSSGYNLVSYTFSITPVYYSKQGGSNLVPVPLPTTGTNNGLGGLALTSIFANAAKVSSGASVANEAILIPTSDLLPYGSPAHASVSVSGDSRAWLFALYQYLVNNVTVRTTTVQSSITSAIQGANAIFTPPAAYYATTNATSGVALADLPLSSFITRTYSLTMQRNISTSTDTGLSMNLVTA